jgi:glucose/arabinose dehydrogenase
VVRFTEREGEGTDLRVIFDKIPADRGGAHNGGRLRFGPDGKLYVTTGSAKDSDNEAQNVAILEGKILRLNPDGSVPEDNPIPGSPVYAVGLRNPYGIDFHPMTGQLYASDNGAKDHEELNLIHPGGNYGWPVVTGATGDARFIDPIWDSGSERQGVSGLAIYSGAQFPDYEGDVFFCVMTSDLLRRVKLAPPGYDSIQLVQDLPVHCQLDVANGPDGALYVADLNRVYRVAR